MRRTFLLMLAGLGLAGCGDVESLWKGDDEDDDNNDKKNDGGGGDDEDEDENS
jgi:hypothetical protein